MIIEQQLHVVDLALSTSPLIASPLSIHSTSSSTSNVKELNANEIQTSLYLCSFLHNFLYHLPSVSFANKKKNGTIQCVDVLRKCVQTFVQLLNAVVYMHPPSTNNANTTVNNERSSGLGSSPSSASLSSDSGSRLALVLATIGGLFECVRIGKSWRVDLFCSASDKSCSGGDDADGKRKNLLLHMMCNGIVRALRPERFAPISHVHSDDGPEEKKKRRKNNDNSEESKVRALSLLSLSLLTKQIPVKVLLDTLHQESGHNKNSGSTEQ